LPTPISEPDNPAISGYSLTPAQKGIITIVVLFVLMLPLAFFLFANRSADPAKKQAAANETAKGKPAAADVGAGETARRKGDSKAVRLAAYQLWEQFQNDPVQSPFRLARVQVSGRAYSSQQKQNTWEVLLAAHRPRPVRVESVEDTYTRIAEASLQTPKTITCYFAERVNARGEVVIEGEFSEYKPKGDGGTIVLVNCRLVN
jgi:hypothetical protein